MFKHSLEKKSNLQKITLKNLPGYINIAIHFVFERHKIQFGKTIVRCPLMICSKTMLEKKLNLLKKISGENSYPLLSNIRDKIAQFHISLWVGEVRVKFAK